MKLFVAKQHAKAFLYGMQHPIKTIRETCWDIADDGIKNLDKGQIMSSAGAAVVIGVPCAVYFSLKHKIGALTEENEVLKIERDTYRHKNIIAYNALKAVTSDRELTQTEKEVVDVCDTWQAMEQIYIF